MDIGSMRYTVATLEKQKEKISYQLGQSARQLTKAIETFQRVCDDLKTLQGLDDRDVQAVHRDIGEVAGAEDQHRLGALLVGLENQVGAGTPQVPPAGLNINAAVKSVHDLRAIVEVIRVRNKRVDVARLKAYAVSAQEAINRGDWATAQRFGESIVIELANGLRS
jgi:hypothetical protein